MSENTRDHEHESSLKLPASAKVLSKTDETGHDGTKYKRWIIFSPERIALLGNQMDAENNKLFLKTLKEAVPNEDFGNPVGSSYYFSDWQNERGQWQAAAIETDKGFFLNLENIVLD